MCGRTCPQPTHSWYSHVIVFHILSERKCSMHATLPIRRTHLRCNTIHFKYQLIIHGMWGTDCMAKSKTMTMWRVAKFSSGSSRCSSFTENYYYLWLVWMMANKGMNWIQVNEQDEEWRAAFALHGIWIKWMRVKGKKLRFLLRFNFNKVSNFNSNPIVCRLLLPIRMGYMSV